MLSKGEWSLWLSPIASPIASHGHSPTCQPHDTQDYQAENLQRITLGTETIGLG